MQERFILRVITITFILKLLLSLNVEAQTNQIYKRNYSPNPKQNFSSSNRALNGNIKTEKNYYYRLDETIPYFLKVLNIKDKCYEYVKPDRTMIYETTYDTFGRLMNFSWYDTAGTQIFSGFFIYNKEGNLIWQLESPCDRSKSNNFEGQFFAFYNCRFKYDKKQNLVKQTVWIESGLDRKLIKNNIFRFKYSRNNILRKKSTSGRPNLHPRNKFEERFGLIPNGSEFYKENNKKSTVSYSFLKVFNILIGKNTEKYKYNAEGKIVEKLFVRKRDSIVMEKLIFDTKGQLIEHDLRTYKYLLKYNSSGFLTELSTSTINGIELNSTFEYFDKNGNWLQRIIYSYNKPAVMIQRILEYY